MPDYAVPVLRNEAPLVLLSMAAPTDTLAAARAALKKQGLILDSDVFVDHKGFPVPQDSEAGWTLDSLLSRSGEKTLKLKSTEREPKKSLLERLTEAPPKGEAVEPAKLPDATPASAQLKLGDEAAKAIDFKSLIGSLAMGSDALTDPVALDVTQWKLIIERNNLLRGLRIDTERPTAAFRPAFAIVGDIPRFVVDDTARVTSTVTHSDSVHAMVENKFSKVEASASYSFVSASLERTHRYSQSTTDSHSKTRAIGAWQFPRVVVQLRPEDLKPAPELVAAVRAALDTEGDPERKYYALRRVFKTFGQVWATEVTLGGELSVSDTVDVDASTSETVVEDSVRAAVSARISLFKASAGATVSSGTDVKDKHFSQFQAKDFVATGGDTRRTQEPGAWVSTVGPAANWRVIQRQGLLPLYMVLEPALRDEVRALLLEIDPQLSAEALSPEPPVGLPADQAMRAERDGFLVARLQGAPASGAEHWALTSGRSTLPGQPPAVATLWTAGTDRIDALTLTLPVRRRELMLLERRLPPHGSPPATPVPAPTVQTAQWFETGYLDEAFFDPWEDIDFPTGAEALHREQLDRRWRFRSDGFLVLTASHLYGQSGHAEMLLQGASLAQLWVDRSSSASACVPVQAGLAYQIRLDPAMELRGRYIPINPAVARLADPQTALQLGVGYLAESDGFVYGLFVAPANTAIQASLTTAGRRDALATEKPMAALSLLVKPGVPALRAGCIGLPLRKGTYYQFRAGEKAAVAQFMGSFYPIRRY